MTGSIPQSSALFEASLLSRDPEGYTRQDLDRIIFLMREQRARWEATEAAGPRKAPKASSKLSSTVAASLDDLGL